MVLTTLLFNQLKSDLKDDIEAIFLYGAIGDDDTTPEIGNTALGSEVFRDSIDEVDKSGGDTIVLSLRVGSTEANGSTVEETGWFNASVEGSLWLHSNVNTINKTSDIQVFLDSTITIEITEG